MLTIGIYHKTDIFRLKKKLIQFILNLFYIGIIWVLIMIRNYKKYNNHILQKSALAGSPSQVAMVEPTLAISSDVPPGI